MFPGALLSEMIAGFLAGEDDDLWITALEGETPIGFCFAAPEEMTDATWNMRALCVAPDSQRRGAGRALVETLERDLAGRGGRLLIVDTTSLEDFAPARAFYDRAGYDRVAVIADFWAAGEDKITYRKAL